DEAVLQGAQTHDLLALHRLRGDYLGLRVVLLEPAADPHEGPAGAEAGDERRHLVQLLEDLHRRALVVAARVRLVPVLVGHEVARVRARELERQLDGAIRPLGALRVDDLGAEHPQELAALLGHVVGHHGLERVALAAADHRQGYAGVPGRGLEDRLPGLDRALRLSGLDHGLRDPVLDRAGGVPALELGVDAHAGLGRPRGPVPRRRDATAGMRSWRPLPGRSPPGAFAACGSRTWPAKPGSRRRFSTTTSRAARGWCAQRSSAPASARRRRGSPGWSPATRATRPLRPPCSPSSTSPPRSGTTRSSGAR